MDKKLASGFVHGIVPAFFLAVSVGQIYAFTNFATDIAEYIGSSQGSVQFAFSLGIFFLGMGAAFFGKIVEKNIKLSTCIGTVLFIAGMLTCCMGIRCKSLPLIYLGYGFLGGLGTGIIYISPVKTMMMWFTKYKALGASLPIIFFGLGSTFSTFIYSKCIRFGIENIFLHFALIYVTMMAIGAILLKKPISEAELAKQQAQANPGAQEGFSYGKLLKDRFFIHSWLFMFLNISSGLCLIPLAKQMMNSDGIGYSAAMITTIVSLCGIMNGGGRFVFAFWSDKLKRRINIICIILAVSLVTMSVTLALPVAIGAALLIINACYGAGFSVIPAIISDKFGMGNISKIHGAVLSAWGVAGLVGNQLSMLVSTKLGYGSTGVLLMLVILYALNLVNFFFMKRLALANTTTIP